MKIKIEIDVRCILRKIFTNFDQIATLQYWLIRYWTSMSEKRNEDEMTFWTVRPQLQPHIECTHWSNYNGPDYETKCRLLSSLFAKLSLWNGWTAVAEIGIFLGDCKNEQLLFWKSFWTQHFFIVKKCFKKY